MLEAQLGFAAPLGLFGLAVDYAPIPELAFNLGIGAGFAGLQYALSGRLRVVRFGQRAHFAPYVGAGFSMGAYDSPINLPNFIPGADGTTDNENPSPHYHWSLAYWTNAEAGIEMRFGNVALRPFFGATFLLNPGSSSIVYGEHGEAPPGGFDRWGPYIGIAVGYALAP